MEEKQIIIDNLLLNYYALESEKESSKIVVFLHGWRSDSRVWFETMNAMSKAGYNCIALDLPGFGKSQLPTKIFDTDTYSQIVVDFLKKLGIEEATCVGHSYGGRILIDISVTNKLKLKRIVLVDASGVAINEGAINVKKIIAKIVKPVFQLSFMKNLREKIYKQMGAEDYIVSQESPFFKETYLNILKDTYNEDLPLITTQTYLIWGENDNDTPVEMGAAMEESIPKSRLEFIMNAGHYPFLDNPEDFQKVLLLFLETNLN